MMNGSAAHNMSLNTSAASPGPMMGASNNVLKQSDMTFIVTPPQITFKDFKDHQKYSAKLSFKNQTTTTQYVRLVRPEGRFFSISVPKGGSDTLKVAAGLDVTYTVHFTPERDSDYECDLVAFTDHERFVVPVRSIGSRGKLSLPNKITFDAAPIKSTTRKTILITNIGSKPCDWRAAAADPFSINPACGVLVPDGSQQVVVEFKPSSLMNFESSIQFDLGRGETQSMAVMGSSVNVDIVLESDTLIIPKTFISLERQGVITVFNRSDETVDFAWKEHRTDEEEDIARQIKVDIAAQKADEGITTMLSTNGANGEFLSSAARRVIQSEVDVIASQPLCFDDDGFTIEPVTGTIPARGKREFTVTFNPQLAITYVATAYLDIQGKSKRLPLQIKGVGLGPHCALGFDNLDLGDIFINSLHQYEVVLENRGSIEAKWVLQPQNTVFGPKFKITPNNGVVPVGSTQLINISFCSDVIGIISETFRFHVQGSKDELELHFKGRVIGPTFHFDSEELDFGNVSYNFWHTKTFSIINTSEIPMKFQLRVPEDHPVRREFEVVPDSGMILPHGRQKVQVDFLSNTVQEYNAHLVVDVDEVGENLDSLPIKATCIAPDITVSKETIEFGSCFIGYPYTHEVELRNDTALSAKYEVILPADDDPIRKKADINIGTGDPKERKGLVPARSTQRIAITQTAKATGNIHVPLYIRILGSDAAPHLVALSSKVTGPKVEVQPHVLDFATLAVLTESSKPIMLVNNSPIPAHYTAKLMAKHSSSVIPPFSLKVSEGTLAPMSSAPIHVTAFLDESMKFEDELVISVQHNAENESVQLLAKGKGFAIVPSIPLDLVDFADLFTTVPVKKTFVLQNRGRRAQQIQWSNERGKGKEGDPPIVFTITPERVELKGKSEETFTIEGLCNTKGVFFEKFLLKQNQTHKVIMKSMVQGSFIPPLLSYSDTNVPFAFTYSPTMDPTSTMFTKPLTLKNVSPLTLTFSLKLNKATSSNEPTSPTASAALPPPTQSTAPFSLDRTQITLRKGEAAVVNVAFDAGYRCDRISHKVKVKLTTHFTNHAQRDNITLIGDVNYPNVSFDSKEADFGCILNDTEQRKTIRFTNTSTIPAAYTWVFEEKGTSAPSESGASRRSKTMTASSAQLGASDGGNNVPINNVFDVVPFRGVVPPGQTEVVEVTFNGIPARRFAATAICQVEGGPDYSISLQGESSSIHYKFDKVALDFDSLDFDKWEEKDIIITNTGRVPFPFHVDLSILSRPGMIEVTPMHGVITDKVKLTVRFSPRVPDNVNDNFKVQVAHFEPQIINIRGHGSYSCLLLSAVGTGNFVTRDESTGFLSYLRDARQRINDPEFRPYTAINGKGPDGMVIDLAAVEAERLLFRDVIVEDLLRMKAIQTGDAPPLTDDESARIKRKLTPTSDVKYIPARYDVDLGSVIKGESKRRSFRLTNSATQTIMFSVDRRALAGSPITLTPDKFSKLPVGTSQVVEVGLNTKAKSVAIGAFSQEVLFEIKGGPLILVNVHANVVLPQLNISSEQLDFGTVLVGRTRVVSVMIENTQSLPCDWQAAYPDSDNNRRRAEKHGQFTCKPERGTLMPNQKEIIAVSFTPVMNESLTHRVFLKIASNPKNVEITCNGVGEELNVGIEPTEMELEPVFPFHTSTKNFRVFNHSSVPVELFSYDFDEKYLIEEEVLRNAADCFVNDVLLLPPREVGASLPDYLMESYYNKLLATDQEYATLDFVPTDDEMSKPATAAEHDRPTVASPAIPNQQIAAQPQDTDNVKPTMVLFVGPSLSGKSVHGNRLCESHGLLNICIDDVISTSIEMDTPEGAAFRSVWHHQLFPPTGREALASAPANPKDAKSKAEAIKAAQAAADAAAKAEVSPASIAKALAVRLRHPDAAHGVVISDLTCFLTNNIETLLIAVKEATAAAGFTLVVVDLCIDALLGDLREALEVLQICQEKAITAAVKPLLDEEYDRLTIPQKRNHDFSLKRQRDTKKAYQQASKVVEEITARRNSCIDQNQLITIQDEVERDIQAAKEAEDPKAKKTKKPKEAEITPSVDWDELTGPSRAKKIFEITKGLFDDSQHHTIKGEGDVDEIQSQIVTILDLPTPIHSNIDSGLHEDEMGNVTHPGRRPRSGASVISGQPTAEIEIPAPQTFMRIERPKEKRALKPVKFFKILTPVTKEVHPVVPSKDNKKPKVAPQPVYQEVLEERSRWILQPGASTELTVQFRCDDVSPHDARMTLGIVGSTQELALKCKTASSYPDIIRDPRGIFPRRKIPADAKYPAKVYIAQQKRFDFGPLLVAPVAVPGVKGGAVKPAGKEKGADASIVKHITGPSVETLKMTNSGAFPAVVTFGFENADKMFVVQPDNVSLDVGQSCDILVSATPDSVGEFRNSLIVCIKDNPEPVKFDIGCLGTRPSVLIDGKKETLVDFGRLLVRKQAQKTITVRSESLLPIKWRLTALEKLTPELAFDITSGTIEPEGTATINVTFMSERTNGFNIPIKMEITDDETDTLYETIPVNLKAEAHDVIMEWTREIDFKTVRVGEAKKEMIRTLNKGPYEVAYQFKMSPKMAEVVTITPMEGTIRGMQGFKDAAVGSVEAVFKSAFREVNITPKRFGEIELYFLDPQTKNMLCPPQNILVRGEALHHKYSIKPQQLNFGACLYRQKKTTSFDITNSGVFDLKFMLYNFRDGIAKALEPPSEPEQAKKKTAEKKGKKGHEADLVEMPLGAFLVSPSNGVVPPNSTTTVTVSILPEGNTVFSETLGIYIEDCSQSTPQGTPFEIEAESCVPGIIADLDSPEAASIFEEQQTVPRLEPTRNIGHVYSREDRCFSFGLALTGRKQSERLRLTNPTKVPATVNVRITSRGDASDAKAAAEVFEVSDLKNSNGKLLIPPNEHRYVTVGFSPVGLNTYSAFFEATVENSLDPKTKQLRLELRGEGSLPNVAVDIPPPPVRPLDAAQTTETNSKPKAKTGGKGAVKGTKEPTEEDRNTPNTLVLPRTIIGTSASRFITLRNVGELPATVRFTLPMSTCSRGITFPNRNEDISLLPGAVEKYAVFFEPDAVGSFAGKLHMSVQDNHYEDMTINVVGEGYYEPVTFADIDENTENRLTLGDCYINVPKTKTFTLVSHAEKPVRFSLASASPLVTFTPSLGHMPPGTTKSITVTFRGTTTAIDTAKATVKLQSIISVKENDDEPDDIALGRVSDWDDAMKTSRWVHEGASALDSSMLDEDAALAAVRGGLRRVAESVPEPKVDVINSNLASKDLYIGFVCDYTSWEICLADELPPLIAAPAVGKDKGTHQQDVTTNTVVGPFKQIQFDTTKILQKRSSPLIIHNTGKVRLPYRISVEPLEGDEHEDADHLDAFSINPAVGEIAPGQTERITVRYTPITVGRHIQTIVVGLPYGQVPEALIPISGSAECPLIHINLPQSDDYQLRRSDKPPVDADTSVISFFSKGVKIRNTVRFMVVNPSTISYEFEWVDKSKNPLFKCSTMRGTIHSGKKYEMVFEYLPESLDTQEADWSFHISHNKITMPFLLIGWAAEPELHFSQSKVDFGQVIVGAKSKQVVTIENRETIPYPFTFDNLGANSAVTFFPSSGVIPPQGAQPVEITFSPKTEDPYNYTLNCVVKKALAPLTCNVKGEGYMTHDTLRVQEPNGSLFPLNSHGLNTVSLGTTQVNGNVSKRFMLTNQGRYNMDYKWQLAPNPYITLSNMIGTVLPGGNSTVDVTYAPTKEGKLIDYKMTCKVTNGSTYSVLLNATAANPLAHFSWEEYDFGPCFVYNPAVEPMSTVLTVTNRDKQPISIDSMFENKEHLELNVASFILNPNEKRDVKITFYPRDVTSYFETLHFSLNDLTRVSVQVRGEGTTPKLDISSKVIRFGTAQVLEKKEMEVRVTCRSKVPTFFSLEGCLPTELSRLGVSVFPESGTYLKPRETRSINFTFKPTARMRPFSHAMNINVQGKELPFVVVSGSCQGAEVQLDCKTISFGSVVVGTRVSRKINILNSGDVSLDYTWNERKLGQDYSIVPAMGVAPAHSETRCDLIYHPVEPNRDGKRELDIRFSEGAHPLPLFVTGTNSVERPPLTDILSFACRVRETATQKFTIKNDSQDQWTLKPIISNTAWSAPETVIVRPRDQTECIVTYAPTVSTQNRADGNDSGTLFVALPSGNALLYRLDGIAEPPAVSAPPLEREFHAKTTHVEKLVVNNWLSVPQKFAVTQSWGHDIKDPSIIAKGVTTIDVPANSTREYRLTFFSFKEGRYTGSITFVNESSKEYQFYNVAYNVKPPKEMAVVEMKTKARQRVTKTVVVQNPLSKAVTLTNRIDNPEVVVPPTIVIPAKSDVEVPLEFFPLLAKEYPPAKLVLSSTELGDFPFTVNLSSATALPEKPIRLSCALGQLVSTSLRFTHFSKAPAEFAFKMNDPKQAAFTKTSGSAPIKVNASTDIKIGQEVVVDVTFEPPRVGEFRETVELVSPVAGTYVFSLLGVCTEPQRQGPIEVRPNQSTQVVFKNVFNENVNFAFTTDDPQFVVGKPSELLAPKKTISVTVTYKCDNPQAVARGKLTISGSTAADASAGSTTNWTYYLRGMKESEATPPAANAAKKSGK